jgi:hypothetical protein
LTVAKKKLRSSFSGGQNVAEKNRTKAVARGKGFGFFAGLRLGCAIGQNAGQFRYLRNPAPVGFLFKINDKVQFKYYSLFAVCSRLWEVWGFPPSFQYIMLF